MTRTFIYIFIFIIYNLAFSQAKNPSISRYGFEVNIRPPIIYNTFISNIYNSKFIFHLNIQNDIIQFQKINNKYIGKYEVSLTFRNKHNNSTMLTDAWAEDVLINDFNKTNSKADYQKTKRILNLNFEPGQYEIFVEVLDGTTGNVFRSTRGFKIKNKENQKDNYSNLVLLESKDNLESDIQIAASKNIVEYPYSPLYYFEFSTPVSDSVYITSELVYLKEVESSIFIGEHIEEIFRKKSEYNLNPADNYLQFVEEVDISFLVEGKHRIKYTVEYNQNRFTLIDTFEVVWFDKPIYLYKYDLALRPMKYLLSGEEYENVEDLSLNELEDWFKDYWKEKDNTPETPFNEVQNEFYLRVQKSIHEFSLRFKEGWRTERGETLILYGEPDRVDKHHHITESRPYEIWYYENLNKKITFIDKKGSGEFNLVRIENIKE